MNLEVIHGDCLEKMKELQSGSIDLILTDPPYGNMKGADLDGWKGTKTNWDTAINPKDMFKECERVLRENGTLILFSQEPYTSRLITEAHNNLPFIYRMIWLKDHFANALIAKVAPVSYYEDILVFSKKYDTLNLNPLREYARMVMKYIGLNLKEINRRLGHRRAEHFFYVETTQFGICTNKTYSEITEVFRLQEMEGFMEFEEMKNLNCKLEKVFNLPSGENKKSNVLNYKKDYGGLHPTQKPVELLRDLIRTYSNKGDTVLDFTAGSFSTLVACEKEKRNGIGIELDKKFCEVGMERLLMTQFHGSRKR